MMMRYGVFQVLVVFVFFGRFGATTDADEPLPWSIGLAKVDVTPTEPVRLSGYGSRSTVSEGVDTPLHVRTLAFRPSGSDDPPAILISVDTIGIPGELTRDIATKIEQEHGTPRDRVAICNTHTHSGPHLPNHLTNIFETSINDAEQRAAISYQERLVAGIHRCVAEAIQGMRPANLHYASGAAHFAVNRRVIMDGRWKAFGVRDDGPVDTTVDVLRVTDADGRVRGLVFNYACHCTTVAGSYNRVNADWAGYATAGLESAHEDAVAMCTIGCGADANPEPRNSVDAAMVHGRTLAAEVDRVASGTMQPINVAVQSRFDYAALSFELPTEEELKQRLESESIQAARHAKDMLEILEREHRLPATHPIPIQTWQFGNQLSMIFLGGEVVSDYSLRLRRELPDRNLWITAYANDVPGYIASERMISEGGYEYDRSGVYYSLPGPWASGTEDRFIDKMHELLQSDRDDGALSVSEAIKKFDLSAGYQIECVAAEPLVEDPVNIAFDVAGRMWVVEMGDYPVGDRGGKVKILVDQDRDGNFDSSTTFLDELSFPTGVMPWRDGALISAAPDILFARDIDGDNIADEVQPIYTGFRLANPQHRINGFTYGLDHSLHLASGDNLGQIKSELTGESMDASGHDVQIWPDDGHLAATSGRSQFVRSRNDRGDWFGNNNSRPMFHYPIDESDLARNSLMRFRRVNQPLFSPPVAPPVFALSDILQRFNDLTAAGRFTSACSAIIVRSPGFSTDESVSRSGKNPVVHDEVAMICEPVHNLIHRAVIEPNGATFRALRCDADSGREFLRSSDRWFRPVRVVDGPDGCLYVVDMYRLVIEHPEWIPQAWQNQIDLRSGQDRGRIYRISLKTCFTRRSIVLESDDDAALVDALRQPVGTRRDLAQQRLLERNSPALKTLIEPLLSEPNAGATIAALWILNHRGELSDDALSAVHQSQDTGVVINAIRIARTRTDRTPSWSRHWIRLTQHADPAVVKEAVLALGDVESSDAADALAGVLRRHSDDEWMVTAVASSSLHHAESILVSLMSSDELSKIESTNALADWIATAIENDPSAGERFATRLDDDSIAIESRMTLASALVDFENLSDPKSLAATLTPLYENALQIVVDSDADESMRCRSIDLFGRGLGSSTKERQLLASLLTPTTPHVVQRAAIDAMLKARPSAGTSEDPLPGADVLDHWSAMTHSLRDHCIASMLQRSETAKTLIVALENETISTFDLSPSSRNRLTLTGSRSMRVRAERLFRQTPKGTKPELIRKYLAAASKTAGNADSGKVLFDRNCAVCHVADQQGQSVGANLANLTDRRDHSLLTAILDPNQALDPKYIGYVVLTNDGRIVTGVIEEEIGDSVALVTADNRRIALRRDEIAEMKSTGASLMPEGFESSIAPEAMSDLLAYLKKHSGR